MRLSTCCKLLDVQKLWTDRSCEFQLTLILGLEGFYFNILIDFMQHVPYVIIWCLTLNINYKIHCWIKCMNLTLNY